MKAHLYRRIEGSRIRVDIDAFVHLLRRNGQIYLDVDVTLTLGRIHLLLKAHMDTRAVWRNVLEDEVTISYVLKRYVKNVDGVILIDGAKFVLERCQLELRCLVVFPIKGNTQEAQKT